MIVSNGKSRCQVKRVDGVDYCLNVKAIRGLMPLKEVYSMVILPNTITFNESLSISTGGGWVDMDSGGGGGYAGPPHHIDCKLSCVEFGELINSIKRKL